MMMRTLFAIALMMMTASVQADTVEKGTVEKNEIDVVINALHGRFIQAFETYDPATYLSAYDKGAVYLRSDEDEMLVGHAALLEQYRKPAAGEPRRELSIRVVSRAYGKELVSDAAWFRIENFDNEDTLVGSYYGRVLLVSVPQTDGRWAYIHDMDTPASKDLWKAAQKTAGLYFDE